MLGDRLVLELLELGRAGTTARAARAPRGAARASRFGARGLEAAPGPDTPPETLSLSYSSDSCVRVYLRRAARRASAPASEALHAAGRRAPSRCPMCSDIETFTVSPRFFFASSATFTPPNCEALGARVDVGLRGIERLGRAGRGRLGLEVLHHLGDGGRRGNLGALRIVLGQEDSPRCGCRGGSRPSRTPWPPAPASPSSTSSRARKKSRQSPSAMYSDSCTPIDSWLVSVFSNWFAKAACARAPSPPRWAAWLAKPSTMLDQLVAHRLHGVALLHHRAEELQPGINARQRESEDLRGLARFHQRLVQAPGRACRPRT